jgi:hypothetical protein
MGTTVKNIILTTAMNDKISNGGTLTDDGKYVVSAYGRFTGTKDFTPSSKAESAAKGVETKITMRFDVAVFEYADGKQGDAIIDYISMRLMEIKSAKSAPRTVLSGLDNDTNRQYKNFVVGGKIWKTLQEEISRAVEDASDREISGVTGGVTSNIALISNADKFMQAAMAAQSRALKNNIPGTGATKQGEAPTSNEAAEKKLRELKESASESK